MNLERLAEIEREFDDSEADDPNWGTIRELLEYAKKMTTSNLTSINSVLKPWVMQLGLRHQGVLLAAVRGCDTAPRNDASKNLVRCYRAEIMEPFCGDPRKSASFIEGVDQDVLIARMQDFIKDHDHYPNHYVGHFTLAAEIVGYKKPNNDWLEFYKRMCKGLHVTPETEAELDARLGADERTFGMAQPH